MVQTKEHFYLSSLFKCIGQGAQCTQPSLLCSVYLQPRCAFMSSTGPLAAMSVKYQITDLDSSEKAGNACCVSSHTTVITSSTVINVWHVLIVCCVCVCVCVCSGVPSSRLKSARLSIMRLVIHFTSVLQPTTKKYPQHCCCWSTQCKAPLSFHLCPPTYDNKSIHNFVVVGAHSAQHLSLAPAYLNLSTSSLHA